ncbi:MAG: glycosyltransferase family 39 protein [Bdellovibrionota bacterium]
MSILRPNLSASIAALVVTMCALRFVALDVSPPGFYVDEAAIAAQVLCLRDSGHDLFDQRWPLFTPVLGGGYATPPMLYLGAAWTKFFGGSIASFRAFSALFGVLFVGASYLLSLRLWRSKDAALLSALCAAISPWAFQFSRISWDPALAPGLLALSLALFFTGGRHAIRWSAVSGIVAAAAAYAYPPLRVQLVLVVPALFVVLRRVDRESASKRSVVFATALSIAVMPLVVLTVRGDIQGRFNMLSVFNENYLRQFGEPSFFAGLWELVKNFGSHFSPRFLLFRGDGNPRHATSVFGEWSPLEVLACAIVLAILFKFLRERRRPSRSATLFTFAAFGYAAGVLPAAMTWESNPHALRSIGALVFLSFGAGGALALVWHRGRRWQSSIAVLALGFCIFFYADYFFSYPKRAEIYFDTPGVRKLLAFERDSVPLTDEAAHATPELRDYPTLALRYFQMESGIYRCK